MTQLPLFEDFQTESAFEKYDAENPQVWAAFVRFTFEVIRAGRTRFSSEAIINRMRWETAISGNDGWKINNNYTPFYARKFHAAYPEHGGFFTTRLSKADE